MNLRIHPDVLSAIDYLAEGERRNRSDMIRVLLLEAIQTRTNDYSRIQESIKETVKETVIEVLYGFLERLPLTPHQRSLVPPDLDPGS